MLDWTLYSTLMGVFALLWIEPQQRQAIRVVALMTSLAGLFCGIHSAFHWPSGNEVVTLSYLPWLPDFGIHYFLAADGISLVLVLLTGIASTAGILMAWNIEHRVKEFFLYFLVLIFGVYGVFLSYDLVLFLVFFEIAIIPKYFLIAIWGSGQKEYAAMKLVLYSFVGSALAILGVVAAYAYAGAYSANLMELAHVEFSPEFQKWAFPLVFVGFGVLAGLWPFHSWAPTGHVAAPTPVSMILAGVVMKLGAYGAFRVAMTLFPAGLAMWRQELVWLAVAGILFGALVSLVQKDFKFVIGFSSVSHMGFVLLGLLAFNRTGFAGAVLQMFSHGVIAGLLFAVVGRMVYVRTSTRDLDRLEGMGLGKRLPFAAGIFLLAAMASMGVPGFSGFVAELQVLMGAWQAFPLATVLALLGVLLGAAYGWRALRRTFLAPAPVGAAVIPEAVSLPEKAGALLLLASSLVVGLYPQILLQWILPAMDSPLFDGLWKEVAR